MRPPSTGKTVETIALIVSDGDVEAKFNLDGNMSKGHTLVVTTLSTIHQW
jgi:SNF2 family DNA or RNA helicase